MKNIKYIFLSLFICLSFFLTDKALIFIDNQKPLMREIKLNADYYKEEAVNSIIKDNTIIPGIMGKKVNYQKSLLNMEDFGYFNETFLVYDYIKPDISVLDNKNKIIIKGNPVKRSVSLILEYDEEKIDYLEKNKMFYSVLATKEINLDKYCEYLNGYSNLNDFKDMDSILNNKKLNTNICLLDYNNYDYCLDKNYFLIFSSVNSDIQINNLINNIESGSIILIKRIMSLTNFKMVLSEIKRQDLTIVSLESLISEKY